MSTSPIAKLVTLGCARNEVDSDELATTLAASGWEVSSDTDAPDVVLVNTCGFIASAKAESVDTILAAGQAGTSGRDVPVVAVGCMAERYGQELADELPEAAAVIGFDGYDQLPKTLDRILAGESISSHVPQDRRTLIPLTPTARVGTAAPPGHTQVAGRHPFQADNGLASTATTRTTRRRLGGGPSAPLKIASGCDRRCAFCAIPRFRGAFVSRRPEDIVAEARWLADRGVAEAVLVSENSTSYGKDLGDPRLLEELLRQLAQILPRVRASYLQPAETRPTLLKTIATTPNVAPYFDMSFQHAAGPLLRRMRRFGDGASFLAMVEQIRALSPEAGIRSNVIVGFPGETEADVAQLLDFLSAARLDAVGVFGYSDEEDTEGQLLPNKIDADEIAARVSEVASVAEYASMDRAAARVGTEAVVLVEDSTGTELTGRTEFQGPEDGNTRWHGEAGVGDLVTVTIRDTDGIDLIAEASERVR
ncbi:MAG: radical SAM protein [Actinomycetia bacterium]|nr:radical SAM protein [Actinomycetes bacterium]